MNTKSHYCKFCKQITVYSPIAELEKHGIDIYFCDPCMAEYTFWQDGDPMSESLYTIIGTQMYRWTVSHDGVARLWSIKDPGEPGIRSNKGMKVVQTFRTDYPDITPQNFAAKLKTYLPFL